MFKRIFILVLMPSAFSLLNAQSGVIKGTVKDATDSAILPGTNVVVKGTFIGTTTDSKGQFKIVDAPVGEVTLNVSYMGYQTASVTVQVDEQKTTTIEITLNPSVLSVGEVIVTSARYKKQIKDVPMPMEFVRKDDIDLRMPADVPEALKTAPGVSMGRDGSWGSQVNIRGMGKQNIVLLVDGIRIETATNIAAGLSLVDIYDIDRIEVVKGATSALYGSGAMGGVVNIHTRTGTYRDHFAVGGGLVAGYGTVNRGANGHVALNAGASNWFVKFSGTSRNAENTETPEGTLENSQFSDNNISVQAGLKPLENHEFRINYQRFYAEDVGIPGGAPFPATATATYPEEKREMVSAAYHINKLLPSMADFSIKYSNQSIERRVELIPNANAIVHPNADHLTNSIQLQTDWTLGKKQYLIAGLDAWQRDLTSWRTKEVIPKNQIVGERPVPESDYRSIGLYVQDEIKMLNDNLNLTIGGRVDQIRVTNEKTLNPEYIIVNGAINESPPNQVVLWDAAEAKDVSYSASLGLLYIVAQDIDLSFSAARSFRSPSLEERYQFIQLGAATYFGDPNLEPENGTFLDVGLRIWKPCFSMTGNAFVNFINNKVIDEFQSENLYAKSNVGEARLYGFDVGLDYNVVSHLVLYGSAAYVRGQDTGNDLDLPEIPPFNGRLGLRSPIFNYFTLDFSATMAIEQDKVAAGEQTTPGYTVFDFYLQTNKIKLGSLSNRFVFGIQNITDRAYRYHLSTYRGIVRLEPGRNFLIRWMLDI